MATKKKRKAYKHKGERRLMTASLEQFVAMDHAAAAEGMSWTQWALAILLAKIKYKLQQEVQSGTRKVRGL